MKNKNVVLQNYVSRSQSITAKISHRASGWGLGGFFSENIPFSSITSKHMSSQIVDIILFFAAQNKDKKKIHVYEFGVGLGILGNNILTILSENYSDIYQKLVYHISDISEKQLNDLKNSEVILKHRDKLEFTVMDLCSPTFRKNAPPMVIFHTYLLDALDARHIKVKNGKIYEILVKTSIPSQCQILDTSAFPPRYLNTKNILDIVEGNQDIDAKQRLIFDRRIIKELKEDYKEVPIEKARMEEFEKRNIKLFVQNAKIDNKIFNYSQDIITSTINIFSKLSSESCYLSIDYYNNKTITADMDIKKALEILMCRFNVFQYYQVEPELLKQVVGSCKLPSSKKNKSFFTTINYFDGGHHLYNYAITSNIAAYQYCLDKTFTNKDLDISIKVQSKVNTLSKKEDILQAFHTHHKFDKENYANIINTAIHLFKNGWISESKIYALESLKYSSNIALKAHLLLGDIAKVNNDLNAAEQHFLKAREIAPQYNPCQKRLVALYIEIQDYLKLKCHLKEWIYYTQEKNISYPIVELLKVATVLNDKALRTSLVEWIKQQSFLIPTFNSNQIR